MPGLNRVLKGHRRGEVSILTGPTGSGKTSILAQLSLDYAAQGQDRWLPCPAYVFPVCVNGR